MGVVGTLVGFLAGKKYDWFTEANCDFGGWGRGGQPVAKSVITFNQSVGIGSILGEGPQGG